MNEVLGVEALCGLLPLIVLACWPAGWLVGHTTVTKLRVHLPTPARPGLWPLTTNPLPGKTNER